MLEARRFALVAATTAAAVAGTGGVAAAATLTASMSGSAEVPKASAAARGHATLKLDADKGRVCFTIKLSHVGTVVAGHIHKGGNGVAGEVVVPLFAKATKQPKGCVSADRATLRAIERHPGRYYVNVHTAKYPGGAARGQLRG